MSGLYIFYVCQLFIKPMMFVIDRRIVHRNAKQKNEFAWLSSLSLRQKGAKFCPAVRAASACARAFAFFAFWLPLLPVLNFFFFKVQHSAVPQHFFVRFKLVLITPTVNEVQVQWTFNQAAVIFGSIRPLHFMVLRAFESYLDPPALARGQFGAVFGR